MNNLIKLINREIHWHKDHTDDVPKEYSEAFIKGLEHAKFLIGKYNEVADSEIGCNNDHSSSGGICNCDRNPEQEQSSVKHPCCFIRE